MYVAIENRAVLSWAVCALLVSSVLAGPPPRPTDPKRYAGEGTCRVLAPHGSEAYADGVYGDECDRFDHYYGPWHYMRYNNMCYQFAELTCHQCAGEVTQDEARDLCRADGGELVSIHDDLTNAFLMTLSSWTTGRPRRRTWIGLTGSNCGCTSCPCWVWDDGTPFDYDNWDLWDDEPDNGDPQCVVMRPNGRWRDLSCGGKKRKKKRQVDLERSGNASETGGEGSETGPQVEDETRPSYFCQIPADRGCLTSELLGEGTRHDAPYHNLTCRYSAHIMCHECYEFPDCCDDTTKIETHCHCNGEWSRKDKCQLKYCSPPKWDMHAMTSAYRVSCGNSIEKECLDGYEHPNYYGHMYDGEAQDGEAPPDGEQREGAHLEGNRKAFRCMPDGTFSPPWELCVPVIEDRKHYYMGMQNY